MAERHAGAGPGELRVEPAEIRAAGAVLWRPGPDGPEVALVHRPRYDDWAFPKGKQHPGEHVAVTAVREVAEETGTPAMLGRRLRPVFYTSGGHPKRVDYWVAAAARAGTFVPGDEVDALAWLPAGAARDRLTYPEDERVLAEFTSAPPATAPIVLVRHASAVSRNRWRAAGRGDDLARPLSARGRAQASALSGILGCYGGLRPVSSPAERCLATLRPYAAAAGICVRAEPSLAPPGPAGEDGLTGGPLVAEAAARGEPAVVCAHRENLPALLSWVCAELGARVPAGQPLRKGEFWVLQTAGGRLVSAERQLPSGG